MEVIHAIFGKGTVVSQDNKTVQVNFNGETKRLLVRFANLTNADGAPFSPCPKKVGKSKEALPKADYSKYSDNELLAMRNELLENLAEAKFEARKDGKTGTR